MVEYCHAAVRLSGFPDQKMYVFLNFYSSNFKDDNCNAWL